jgi:uncharacterized protein (DUF1501 family)
MNPRRRQFLQHSAALGALGLAHTFTRGGIPAALAQTAGSYRALVCVFLFGGNDANNTIAPLDDYAAYSAVRGGASGVAISRDSFLPITGGDGKHYGLHPALAPLHELYSQGKAAALFNAGTLLRPITRTEFRAGQFVPQNLYSHSDQQQMHQGHIPGAEVPSGWGGRMADKLPNASGGLIPTALSFDDNALFTLGKTSVPLAISGDGGLAMSAETTSATGAARYEALKKLIALDGGNLITAKASSIMKRALDSAEALRAAVGASTPAIDTAFAGIGSGLANQLEGVARMIAGRNALGVSHQCFFCGIGGFDTHSEQLGAQNERLNEVAEALRAFYNATVALGVADQVTTFTLSEFGRTLRSRSNAGTDHAWGGHQFVLGGAVKGGTTYGRYPTLVCGGPDDAADDGVWIPTTSLEQYGATLATWFGVGAGDINYVFPNLANFAQQNLGFMKA